MRQPKRPIPDSYWIDFHGLTFDQPLTGRLLAGEYPGAKEVIEARQKIGRFLDAGVTSFLDLTRAGEYTLRPYAAMVAEIAGQKNQLAIYQRMPILDLSIPSPAQMEETLNLMDQLLNDGRTVYVHCYGGIGRTGTVVGCWLVRHGLSGRQALAKIGAWRRGTPKSWRESPETEEQRQMVLGWRSRK